MDDLILPLLLLVSAGYALFFGIGGSFVIAPCYRDLPSRTFIEFFQGLDGYMKVRAKILMLLRLAGSLLVVGLLGFHAASSALWCMVLATLCGLLSTIIAGPLNRVMEGWDATAPPSDWERLRDRWLRLHHLRTIVETVAFAASLMGVVTFAASQGV